MYEPDARQKLTDAIMADYLAEERYADWLYVIRRTEEKHNGKVVEVENTPYGICVIIQKEVN